MKQLSQGKEDEPIEGRILDDNEEIPVRPEGEKSGGQSGPSFFSDESAFDGYFKAHTQKNMPFEDRYERLRRYYEASIMANIYK